MYKIVFTDFDGTSSDIRAEFDSKSDALDYFDDVLSYVDVLELEDETRVEFPDSTFYSIRRA